MQAERRLIALQQIERAATGRRLLPIDSRANRSCAVGQWAA
jgi:hypothetical protein